MEKIAGPLGRTGTSLPRRSPRMRTGCIKGHTIKINYVYSMALHENASKQLSLVRERGDVFMPIFGRRVPVHTSVSSSCRRFHAGRGKFSGNCSACLRRKCTAVYHGESGFPESPRFRVKHNNNTSASASEVSAEWRRLWETPGMHAHSNYSPLSTCHFLQTRIMAKNTEQHALKEAGIVRRIYARLEHAIQKSIFSEAIREVRFGSR